MCTSNYCKKGKVREVTSVQMDMFDLPSVEVSRLWDNTFELCQDYIVVFPIQGSYSAYTDSKGLMHACDACEELLILVSLSMQTHELYYNLIHIQ